MSHKVALRIAAQMPLQRELDAYSLRPWVSAWLFIRTTFLANLRAWFLLIFGLATPSAFAQLSGPQVIAGPGIGFSSLVGPNLAPYTGSAEGNFAITPTAGTWLQSLIYGNPGPSILDGPVNSPGIGVLQITDSAGRFTLSSLDFSSNNGNSSYDIEGFLGSTMEYQETGTLPGTFGPFSFSTLVTAHPSVPIDGLIIEVIPIDSTTTSINLDNIMVTTIPEPGALALAALGLAVAFFHSRCRKVRAFLNL